MPRRENAIAILNGIDEDQEYELDMCERDSAADADEMRANSSAAGEDNDEEEPDEEDEDEEDDCAPTGSQSLPAISTLDVHAPPAFGPAADSNAYLHHVYHQQAISSLSICPDEEAGDFDELAINRHEPAHDSATAYVCGGAYAAGSAGHLAPIDGYQTGAALPSSFVCGSSDMYMLERSRASYYDDYARDYSL